MPTFRYQAITPQGETRAGSLSAGSEREVAVKLQAQGLIPISVDTGGPALGAVAKPRAFLRRKRLGPSDISDFTRQLSILVGAGLSLDRSLKILSRVSSLPPLVALVDEVQASVREGEPLSRALARHPALFSGFYINFVRSAELSGNLAESLEDLSVYLDKSRALRERLLSAMIYPAILVAVTLISLAIIVVYVLPEFASLFADMNAELPASTAFVLGVAEFARRYGIIAVAAIVAGGIYFQRRWRDESWRLAWDRRLLSIGPLADLIRKIEMARFSRNLGTLLKGGVPLLTALRIARESLQNRVMLNRLEEVVGSLREGSGLAGPLMETGVFPEFALQMIQVGEETGQLDTMLIKVADIYDEQVATATQRLLSILEPLLIIGLGVVIGGIIMSILVAILGINELPI